MSAAAPRVLSLSTIYPNEQNSAEGRSVAFLDRALAEQGIAGTTLVLKPYAPQWLTRRVARWRHLAVRDRREQAPGIQVFFTHYLHVPIRYSLTKCVDSMARRAQQLIRQHQLEFDVVHAEGIYPPALAARRVAQAAGVPFVMTLRDDLRHLNVHLERPGGRERFADAFGSVSAIFVIGPALERDVPQFIPAGAHPRVILAPNGVDAAGLEAMLATFPPAPPRTGKHIVSVSNLYRTKGIHENLRALARLDARGMRDWAYTVVGDGPHRANLERLANELGLAGRVQFVGRLPHRDAVRAIRDADIFSLPSWAEPYGNVYAEAAICARPAIGCRGFGAEMMMRDGETGLLVPPQEIDALADALACLLGDPQRAEAMGEAAARHIRQFTWRATAQQYAEEFRALHAARGK